MGKSKFILSEVTTWEEEEELWETKVGTDEKDMPLWFICVGKTEKESRERAEMLLALLTLKEDISEITGWFS